MMIGGLNMNSLGANVSATPKLRDDFKRELERQLSDLLGPADSPARKALEVEGELKLDNLPEQAQREIKKLADATEGLEAIFVQRLLNQMRRSSFAEKMDGMGGFARDLMDQTLAEQLSKSEPGMGIAKNIFVNAAPRIVREAAAQMTAPAVPTEEKL